MSTPSSLARKIAERASMQAFANCYLREVDRGTWLVAEVWQASAGVLLESGETHVVELALPSLGQTLALGVRFRSLVGRHTLVSAHRRRQSQQSWQKSDGVSAQLLLIDALYAQRPESAQRLELLSRVVESHQVMAKYAERWLAQASSTSSATASRASFAASEQSVVLGHWLHPTPKSRQGMLDWQHDHYAPELGGRFQLHFFAAARALVHQASLQEDSAEELSLKLACQYADEDTQRRLADLCVDHCLLPLHPLQAQWLLHQDHVRSLIGERRLIDVGRLGPDFTATSSVRTLHAEGADLMMKLSIPVKITNALRINLQSELGDSVWISQLLRRCGVAQAFPELLALEDPAYITLALPEMEETGFEVIFRSNPFSHDPSRTVHSIAALVQDPMASTHRSFLEELVRDFAARAGLPLAEAARRWFDAYWSCAVEAPIRIYDGHGIALEGHQQNTLLELDAASLPCRSLYRDIQGVGLSMCFRDELLALVPELAEQSKVFEPDDIVRNSFGYYLFFNQLYAVINRFGLDGLLDEAALLELVRGKLSALRPSMKRLGVELIDTLLQTRAVPCKGNLLTRVDDMDELQADNELAVYVLVDNPLFDPAHGVAHASRNIRQARVQASSEEEASRAS